MNGSARKTNAMRVLDAHRVAYTVHEYPADIHSVPEIAAALGVPETGIVKTLVVLRPAGKPLLVMVPGNRQLDPRSVARAVGCKKVQMATHREAERLTGLQVGGISALALLHRGFGIYLDRAAARLESVLVSAGQRGLNLELAVADLLRVTGAVVIGASADEGDVRRLADLPP